MPGIYGHASKSILASWKKLSLRKLPVFSDMIVPSQSARTYARRYATSKYVVLVHTIHFLSCMIEKLLFKESSQVWIAEDSSLQKLDMSQGN